MRMMRMRRIMDGVHVCSWLSMVCRVSPWSRCCWTVKLMVFLARYTWNLYGRYGVHVAGRQYAGASRGRSFRWVLHARNCDRVALVRLAITETLGERIAGDLQLGDAMILVGCYRGKPSLRKGERFEVFRTRIRSRTRWRGCHYNVAAWLISVHRV